jgi:hypothetical protein
MTSRLIPLAILPAAGGVCRSALPREEWNGSDTDFRCVQEIAQARGLVSLRLDEPILAFAMAWIVESGGECFVLLSIVFEADSFSVEGLIEARTDVVGFAIEVQDGSFVSALGVAG